MDSIHVTAVMNLYLHLFGKGICLKHAKYTWEWQNRIDLKGLGGGGVVSDKGNVFSIHLRRIFEYRLFFFSGVEYEKPKGLC